MTNFAFAIRQLVKAPAFTFIAVLTLALGIGSATTVFTAMNAILLRPLPFIQHQDRMLWLNEALPAKNIDATAISYADFVAWRDRTKTLSAVWVYQEKTAIITGRTEPIRKMAAAISAGAFQAMGVAPIRGRDFRPDEDVVGAAPVALIGYEMWQKEYGGAEDIVGQTVKINNEDTTIIGIMPRGWRYPDWHDLWLPLRASPDELMHHGSFRYAGHAMLKPGVTLAQARAEFATISAALAKEFPATNDGLVAVLRPVREEAAEDSRDLTVLLFGAVMFVFLIACANVANLLLARASARTKEIAIRLALGATRGQLIGQLLIESLVLSLLGGVAGLIVALWGVDLIVTQLPDNHHPFWLNFNFDPVVFAFVAILSVLGSVGFGLMPALQASRPEVIDEIKEGSRGAGGGTRGHRLRNALVVTEVALALVLLVGAGLLMRSFLLLNNAQAGFDPRGVFTFRVGFPTSVTEDPATIRRFFADLMPRLAALPGGEAAAATSALPGVGSGGFNGVLIEGQPFPTSMADVQSAVYRVVTPRYFEVLRIPRKAGRQFTELDDESHPRVAVVDETFAKKYFPGQDPLGKRFCTLGKPTEKREWLEVVGVVGNTRRFFDRDESSGAFYTPHAQNPSNFMSVVLRVNSGDPGRYASAARSEVLAVNKDMPIYYEMSLQQAIERSDSVWMRGFFGRLFTAFACVALLLASIGIYGVMAYSVAQRTQEIGVRMALGAQPRDVIRMVVRQGVKLVALGLAIGFVAAYCTAGLLAGNLYGVSPHDPPTFALVPLLLAAVALLACYVPSRRATLIDPMLALRSE
jgi:putative ABC transport system permease protein